MSVSQHVRECPNAKLEFTSENWSWSIQKWLLFSFLVPCLCIEIEGTDSVLIDFLSLVMFYLMNKYDNIFKKRELRVIEQGEITMIKFISNRRKGSSRRNPRSYHRFYSNFFHFSDSKKRWKFSKNRSIVKFQQVRWMNNELLDGRLTMTQRVDWFLVIGWFRSTHLLAMIRNPLISMRLESRINLFVLHLKENGV